MAGVVFARGARFVTGVLLPLAMASAVAAAGMAAAAEKPNFSTRVGDYLPTKIRGQDVVIDPRSEGAPTGGCQIPAEGVFAVPGVGNDFVGVIDEAFGGIWQCPDGTGFVVSLDAASLESTVAHLSEELLLAGEPRPEQGLVEERHLKVAKGVRVNALVWRSKVSVVTDLKPTDIEVIDVPVEFELASAEPRKHLVVTAVTPADQDPVPYLKAMLRAGLR